MPFDDVLGQEGAVSLLRKLLAADRLPHALLFVGPEGVGKRLTARALAQALLCEKNTGAAAPSLFGDAPAGAGEDGCGTCPSCKRVAQGQHPDYHEVLGEGAKQLIKVEAVRELIRVLQLSSVEGGHKIAVVDPAEGMNREAANTLLKTLEEPREKTLLVLVARERSLLLPTLVSRCQVVRFGFLDSALVRRYFERHQAELSLPEGASPEMAAALSGGSIGRAISLLTEGELGKSRELLAELVGALSEADAEAQLRWAGRLAELSKEDAEVFYQVVDGLIAFSRDVAALCSGCGRDALVSADLADEVERWASRLSLLGALERVEAALEVRRALAFNTHRELAALALAGRLAIAPAH